MTHQRQRGPRLSNRLLLWSAIASFAIGVAPFPANILALEVASELGCYIAEFSIYDRRGTFDDSYDDVPGCHGVGSLLVVVNSFGLAFTLTWPLVLLSLVLWVLLLVRRLNRPAV
jgi:hypothetical protein